MSNQDTVVPGSPSTEKGIQSASLEIGEQEVANYLRRHPAFFEDKPSLLTDMRVPHHAGNAVSLVERQVIMLRESNENRQAQLDALIQIARDNDRLNSSLHQLTLQLMERDDFDAILSVIANRLRNNFAADIVVIRLLSPPVVESDTALPEVVADVDTFCGQFQRLLSTGKPYCGRLKSEQLELLFGDRAEAIGSSAILPLGKNGSVGLLAIGSFERSRFSIGADTDFLARMAEIVGAALSKHLKLTDD